MGGKNDSKRTSGKKGISSGASYLRICEWVLSICCKDQSKNEPSKLGMGNLFLMYTEGEE